MHSQGQDRRVLTCTECKQRVETGWHCPGCQDYDLCINCYNQGPHPRDGEGVAAPAIQRCIQSLRHARQCPQASCQKMKRVVEHTKGCERKTNEACGVCKQFIALCSYHAKHCQESPCPIPYCLNIKQKLRQQEIQYRRQHA
ncbi:CREB-binding protein [Myotis davidii]|uniref:histone acetyltransferase n=1 Tax=Myotis davidii TaxID=225400 RepID=L5MA30_MYODS|nr:CREB-binding protein [Myotis davidii]